jgi:hypothetical protein
MAQLASTTRGRGALLTPLLLLAVVGCFKQTYVVGSGAPTAPSCTMNGGTTGLGV